MARQTRASVWSRRRVGLGLIALAAALPLPRAAGAAAEAPVPAPAAAAVPLRHSAAWVSERLGQMLACDQAYLYNDVLGGRAIHQNSFSKPAPSEPWDGNFHTQQQSYYALVKMELYEQGGRTEAAYLDEARELLAWVLRHGYDAAGPQFYLKYSTKTGTWEKGFYPEFNMINVAGLLVDDHYRPNPEWRACADGVLARIVATDSFKPDRPKGLYAAGYLALKLLDCYDVRREERFLTLARQVVDLADAALWDAESGGWFIDGKAGGELPKHTTKFTHTNANLIQACLRLHLLKQGEGLPADAPAAGGTLAGAGDAAAQAPAGSGSAASRARGGSCSM